MKLTHKIAALFLLSIFLFNTMGYFIAFKALQFQVKSSIIADIKKGIATEAQTIITVDKANAAKINWTENGQEMIYNGNRYDVISSNQTPNSITYFCINDKQEENLFSSFDEHISTHVIAAKSSATGKTKNLADDVVKIFFINYSLFSFADEITTRHFLPVTNDFTSEILKTKTPPPQFI